MTDYSGYTPYDETVTYTGGGWGDLVNQATNVVNQNPALRQTFQQYAPMAQGLANNALSIARSTPMGMVAETGLKTAQGIYNDPTVRQTLAPALQQFQQSSYGQQAQRVLGQAQQAYGQASQAYGQLQQPQQPQQFAMGGGMFSDAFDSIFGSNKNNKPKKLSMEQFAQLLTEKPMVDESLFDINNGNAQQLYNYLNNNGMLLNAESKNEAIINKLRQFGVMGGGKKRVRKLQPAGGYVGPIMKHQPIRFPVRPLAPGESAWNDQDEEDSKRGGKKYTKSASQEVDELYGGCGTCGMDGGKKAKSGGRPRAKSKKSARPKSKKRKARK